MGLQPAARTFLEETGRCAVLGTIRPDGAPLHAVIWYRLEPDETVLINSRVGRLWPADLQRDPRAALTVSAGYEYVAMRGVTQVLHTGAAAVQDIAALAARYTSGHDLAAQVARFQQEERISFRFRATSVTHYR